MPTLILLFIAPVFLSLVLRLISSARQNPQAKGNPLALASLFLGVVTVLPTAIHWLLIYPSLAAEFGGVAKAFPVLPRAVLLPILGLLGEGAGFLFLHLLSLYARSYPLLTVLAVAGLFLGLLALKPQAESKHLARTGIVLCAVSMLGGSLAGFVFNKPILGSVFLVLLLLSLIYLWVKERKIYAAITFFALLSIAIYFLFIAWINTRPVIVECNKYDTKCIVAGIIQESKKRGGVVDITPCSKAERFEECYARLAFAPELENIDPQVCDLIPVEDNHYNFTARRVCYESLALKNRNVSLCEKLICPPDELYLDCQQRCSSRVYYTLALEKDDPSLCERMSTYVTVGDEDPFDLEGGGDVVSLASCYAKIAAKLDNVALCDKILEISEKRACHWEVALEKKDCSLFPSELTVELPAISYTREYCEELISRRR